MGHSYDSYYPGSMDEDVAWDDSSRRGYRSSSSTQMTPSSSTSSHRSGFSYSSSNSSVYSQDAPQGFEPGIYRLVENGGEAYWHLNEEYQHDANLPPYIPLSPAAGVSSRYPCLFRGCSKGSGFKRLTDLKRHTETCHNEHIKLIDCPRLRCGEGRKGRRGFKRKDHLREHLMQYHKLRVNEVDTLCDDLA
ncbi:MAG: hypothetical protein M1825_004009 [Sarcosagium campestre]|nr:MAG: hypothetical protein M1825_004009 [Sarcosagium campestre]